MNEALTISNILQVLQILAILGGFSFFLWRMEARLMVMNSVQNNALERLADLEKEIKKLSEVTIDIARQDERLNGIDKRITLLAQMMEDRWRNSKG